MTDQVKSLNVDCFRKRQLSQWDITPERALVVGVGIPGAGNKQVICHFIFYRSCDKADTEFTFHYLDGRKFYGCLVRKDCEPEVATFLRENEAAIQ